MTILPNRFRLSRGLAVATLLGMSAAHSQVLDDVEVRRVGADAVISIRFVTPVQFVRSVAARTGDVGQLYYEVLPTREAVSLLTSERRLPTGGSGQLLVTDEGAGGADRNRKVVLRFPGAVNYSVRNGANNRALEVVLKGQGAALVPAPAQARAEAPGATAELPRGSAPGAAPAVPAGTVADSAERLTQARRLMDAGDQTAAIALLEAVLALPPHAQTAAAQGLIGEARWRQGDPERARAEFELYLKLYPQGADAGRAREALLTLAPPAPTQSRAGQDPASKVTSTLSGSVSSFYYGGQSKVRTLDFQDSPLSGLPELVSDATLSGTDQRQVLSSVDLNYRRRDADSDLRLVLRDTYTRDLLRVGRNKNKLSALYADYKSLTQGYSVRLGRQTPTGGGVMGRFDGVQLGYRMTPKSKWRVAAVAGQPTDKLLDASRSFWGVSAEADDLLPGFGGTLYTLQQRIDGEVDRRAVGTEMRLLAGPVSAIGSFDYDTTLKGLNIASMQATWQGEDSTVVNVLYDRRATPMLALGNSLFFQNPVILVQARTLRELLLTQNIAALRAQVRDTTAFSTQGMVSITRPLTPHWQVGADLRLTNVGALLPVPDILPQGQPGTGNVWSMGAQLIGSNLYSARDTHVILLTLLKGPTYRGQLWSYNNSSAVGEGWQLEPSLRYYQQSDDAGLDTRRWSPGLRLSKRLTSQFVLEGELSTEFSRTSGPNRHESSSRSFYYLGGRYEL